MGSPQQSVPHNNAFMFLLPKSMADTETVPVSTPSSVSYSLDHKIVFLYRQTYKDTDGWLKA